MRKVYQIIALLLVVVQVSAQSVPPRAAPTTFRSGSYRLADGNWRRGKLLYDEQQLSITDDTHKKEPLVYPADSVNFFAIGRDTFELVHEVDIPRPTQHLRSTFARHLYRRAGFQVDEFVAYQLPPEAPLVYTLLVSPGQPTAVLPPSKVQFRLALAKVVHDFTALSQQLELDPSIMPEQLPELLTVYGRWKASHSK